MVKPALKRQGIKSKWGLTATVLLSANLLFMTFLFISRPLPEVCTARQETSNASAEVGADTSTSGEGHRDFLALNKITDSDKVKATLNEDTCFQDESVCLYKQATVKKCRPWGHYYDTIYQKRLGAYSTDSTEPFQFLEIGFYRGSGFEAFMQFMPRAEPHSIEISCMEAGPFAEGKWPFVNAAKDNTQWYKPLRDANRLHCGDANNVEFLNQVWTQQMKRPDAPPLKVVVDDASHQSHQMAQSVFFWFPKIEPRGIMIVEDIQPLSIANKFRTQFLPQLMADLHFCGYSEFPDETCFPTLQPLLASIHCEMHICVLERNDEPAVELSLEKSKMPVNALNSSLCKAAW
mmetsp:Transcript_16608/g.27522  ORF Transcript_16608/g.27522 Transcript_16608/m.27522 type:complete len:348 (+) Transcript_16608:54-1097(+)